MPSSPPDGLRKPIPTAVTAAGLVNSSNHFCVDTLAGIPCGGLLFGQPSQLDDHVSVTCFERSSVLHTVGSGEGSGGFHILNGDILKARQGSLRDCDLVIGMSSLYIVACVSIVFWAVRTSWKQECSTRRTSSSSSFSVLLKDCVESLPNIILLIK